MRRQGQLDNFFRLGLLILSLGAMHSTWAQENATVLPQGRNRIRLIDVLSQSITHIYNDRSERIELMDKLNLVVPAAQAAAANSELRQLYTSLNAIEKGLGDQLFQTNITSAGELWMQRIVVA